MKVTMAQMEEFLKATRLLGVLTSRSSHPTTLIEEVSKMTIPEQRDFFKALATVSNFGTMLRNVSVNLSVS